MLAILRHTRTRRLCRTNARSCFPTLAFGAANHWLSNSGLAPPCIQRQEVWLEMNALAIWLILSWSERWQNLWAYHLSYVCDGASLQGHIRRARHIKSERHHRIKIVVVVRLPIVDKMWRSNRKCRHGLSSGERHVLHKSDLMLDWNGRHCASSVG